MNFTADNLLYAAAGVVVGGVITFLVGYFAFYKPKLSTLEERISSVVSKRNKDVFSLIGQIVCIRLGDAVTLRYKGYRQVRDAFYIDFNVSESVLKTAESHLKYIEEVLEEIKNFMGYKSNFTAQLHSTGNKEN